MERLAGTKIRWTTTAVLDIGSTSQRFRSIAGNGDITLDGTGSLFVGAGDYSYIIAT